MSGKIWTARYVHVTLIGFCTALTFNMLVPTLPIIAVDRLGASEHHLGWIVGAFTLSVLVARLLIGYLSRWWSGEALLLASALLMVVVGFLYFVVFNMSSLLTLRVFHGILFGIMTTTTSALAVKFVAAHQRGRGIGYYGMFQALSMAIGPTVGIGMLRYSDFSMFAVLLAVTVVSLGLAFILAWILPRQETPAPTRPASSRERHWIEVKAIPSALRMLCIATIFGCILSYLSVLADAKNLLDWIGGYFLCYAIAILLIRPLSGRMADSGRIRESIWLGIGFIAVSLACLNLSSLVVFFLLSGLLLGIGQGLAQTSLQVQSLQDVSPDRYASATGTFFLSLDIGFSIGSIGLGSLLLLFDIHTLFWSLFLVLFAACMLMLGSKSKCPDPLLNQEI